MIRARTMFAQVFAALLVLTLALPVTAGALTIREGNSVTLASTENLADDLYAFGNIIIIDGNVDGDVIAFGQSVVINGDVSGSVITAAQSVRIGGTVDGTVRAAGQSVDVSGLVRGDVLAGANVVSVSGDVDRDLAAGAQTVSVTGSVGRNVMVGSESLLVAGKVGGDVKAQSNRVEVSTEGSVAGDLDYWSVDSADVQGEVSGVTTRHEPTTESRNGRDDGGTVAGAILSAIIAWIQSFMGFLLLGLLLVFIARRPMEAGSQAVADRLLPSLGVGLLVFFATPVAAFIVFGVGLFVGAWWLSFVLMAVYWLLLLAGIIVGSLALGRAILSRTRRGNDPALAWSYTLGLVLVWLAAAVPFLGWLFAWGVMMAGTGALVLLWMGKAHRPVPAPVMTASGPVVSEPVVPVVPEPVVPVAPRPVVPDTPPNSPAQ